MMATTTPTKPQTLPHPHLPRRPFSSPPTSLNLRLLPRATAKPAVGGVNYVVPLDKPVPNCLTRPLVEILRDLNKRIPDKIIKPGEKTSISWYHANRLLSFYAPGWCGEIRDVMFSDDGSVTVVYRVTIRGTDGEAHRESTGTVSTKDGNIGDPVSAAEEIAFCRACARFGLGLYLYHEDATD